MTTEPELIEHVVQPGETFRDALEQLKAHGEAFSEVRVGEITVGRNDGPPRACNSCNACCVLPGINHFKKLPHRPCQHLNQRKRKCGIYATRPGVCEEYYCLWIMGNFETDDRPDKIGAVVGAFDHNGALASIQVDSKAANWPRIEAIFRQLCGSFPRVQIVVDDKTIVIAEAGKGLRRGRILPRPSGDYESTIYELEEGQ